MRTPALLEGLLSAIRADHALIRHMGAKYGGQQDRPEELPKDLVQKVGFQIAVAYRVMRAAGETRIGLAPKLVSRAIRHLYGADIHWEAELAPGVMFVHGMGVAISKAARVADGVVISQNVTLGFGTHPETRETGAPNVGRNVYIGPGATLIGPITIGENSKIMPGCLLMHSVPPYSLVEAPRPVVKPRARAALKAG